MEEGYQVTDATVMYKPVRSISNEILDFLDWFSSDEPNEYEKGVTTGLRIAQTIAEIVERNSEADNAHTRED